MECSGGPPALPTPNDGLTADDIAEIIRDAKVQRVRCFELETVMKGHPVKLSATFEPEPREREKGSHDE